jgi:hypothetical protein
MELPSARALITAVCFSLERLLLITFVLPFCATKTRLGQHLFCATERNPMKTPKIGRPKLPKGEAKSCMIRARVTPSEQKAIEQAANGMGVSEWARFHLLSAASGSFGKT